MCQGSCLCEAVKYELLSEPKAVSHCHCHMCQKQHGTAFATYANLPKTDLRYVSGQKVVLSYNSSGSITRKFCGIYGFNIEWSGSEKFPDWVSITMATLDTPFRTKTIENIYLESKAAGRIPRIHEPDNAERIRVFDLPPSTPGRSAIIMTLHSNDI